MKRYILTTLLLIFSSSLIFSQDVNCEKNQLRYQQLMKAQKYEEAYPIWKEQITKCPSYIVNIYNHGEVILPPLIEKSSGAQKNQYIDDLILSFTQRFKYFPDDKNLIEGNKVSYELQYGRIDSIQAFNQLKDIINKGIQTGTKLSFKTMESFFYNTLNLYYYKKISDEQYINAYDKVNQAIEVNIDIRNKEKAPLEDKIYGVTDSTGKVLVAPTKLSFKEQQIFTSDTANIRYMQNIDTVYAGLFNQYLKLNCNNLGRLVDEGLEANKNNEEWVSQYYYMMDDQGCDTPQFAAIMERVSVLWPAGSNKTRPEGSRGPGREINNTAVKAKQAMVIGNYSEAISLFQKAIDETSSSNAKANYCAGIANCYLKKGSYSNVIKWANKALSYKPGYGTAYLLMAYAYYKGAGQVPGNAIQQRMAGWVAADFARRGGDYKAASNYDKSAPSKQECFMNGIKAGSTVKVGGWINKSTTAKCVAR